MIPIIMMGMIFSISCKSAYKMLQPVNKETNNCLEQFKPIFTRALYNAQVNITGKHLSGLLFIKQMPDSSTRLVFTMETGFKFFDFEFDKAGKFTVHSIMDKLNRKAVINTLKKDFALALMININNPPPEIFVANSMLYHRLTFEKEFNYYITDTNCTKLIRAEIASSRKTKVELIMQNYKDGMPDTIGITHHTFNFDIGLKKLEQ